MTLILKNKGFNYVAYYNGAYGDNDSLPALVTTNANSIATPIEYGINPMNNTVYVDSSYTDLGDLGATIKEAVGKGLQVMDRPLIDFVSAADTQGTGYSPSEFRAYYNPGAAGSAGANSFFSSYHAMIDQQAQIAVANGATSLCIGVELDQLTGPSYKSYWDSIITNLRTNYSSLKLTYSALWDDDLSPWQYGGTGLSAGTGDLATQVSFSKELDSIGIDEYAPISDAANPTVAQLVAGWTQVPTDATTKAATGNQSLISYYESIAAEVGKPLIFTELGYENATDADSSPFGSQTNKQNNTLQANLYQSFFEAWTQAGNSALTGVYFWNWDPNEAEVGPGTTQNPNVNFSPQDLPAQAVITDWFGPGLTVAYGAPTFAGGGQITLSGTAIDSAVTAAVQTVEVYDSAGAVGAATVNTTTGAFTFSTTTLPAGAYSFYVTATDIYGKPTTTSAPFEVVTGGTLMVPSATTAAFSGAYATSGATIENAGTINDTTGIVLDADAGTSQSLFQNDASGIVNITTDGAAITKGGSSASLTNAGIIEKTAGTGASQIGVAVSNTGSIAVSSGTLTLQAGVINFGTVTASTGGHLLIGGVSSEGATGKITATSAGTVTFAAGTTLTNLSGGTLTGGQYSTIGTGSRITFASTISSLAATIAMTQTGSIVETSGSTSTTLEKTLTDVAAKGLLQILAGGTYNSTDAISLEGGITVSGATFKSGLVTGAAGSMLGGTGSITSNLMTSGMITVAAGALTLTGSDTFAGAIQGPGTLTLANNGFTLAKGASLSGLTAASSFVVDASNLNVATSVTDAGAFSETNSSLTFTTTGAMFTVGGASTLTSGGILGSGYLVLSGASTSYAFGILDGATEAVANFLRVAGGIALGTAASGGKAATSGTFSIRTGATVNVADGGSISTANGALGNIGNSGRLEKATGTAVSTVGATITNAGNILAASGTLDFTKAVGGKGTSTITTGATLEFDSSVASTQGVSFGGGGGTLVLEAAPAFAAAIGGLGSGDTIDVGAISATSLTYSPNANNNGGTLAITNGTVTDHLTLAGSYQQGGFSLDTTTKTGDTLITYAAPAAAAQQAHAAQAASSNSLASALFDAAFLPAMTEPLNPFEEPHGGSWAAAVAVESPSHGRG